LYNTTPTDEQVRVTV